LGALYLEKFLPKIVGERGIPVRDNRMWHAMKFEDIIHENLGHCGGSEGMLQSTEMSIFGKTINHHHDEYHVSIFR
jgi:hypothetical protein